MFDPILKMRRGIVVDRCQPNGLPAKTDVTSEDMKIIRATGVDHVKLLFTPSAFMTGHALNQESLWFIRESVHAALSQELPCLICIHPEAAFKEFYLASEEGFQLVLPFYRDLARWIHTEFRPDQVAFQIMTEPFANYCDWNILNRQLWQTVRGELPDHTLVLSGDKTGSLFGMLELTPVEDDNVYYGFTSYDPFAFTLQSWNAFFGGTPTALDAVGHVPYPANPEIIEQRMEEMICQVPADSRQAAMEYLRAYGRGDYQQGNQGCFNRTWIENRLELVQAWRKKHGGHFPVLCNEFGVMDPVMGGKYGGIGILPQERLLFLQDLREAMEARDIAWSYWSFNETFTIFDPAARTPFGHDSDALLDHALLQALGLHYHKEV